MATRLGKSRQVGRRQEILESKALAAELGKSRQVGRPQEILECRLLAAGLGKSRQVGHDGNLGIQAIGSWARQV